MAVRIESQRRTDSRLPAHRAARRRRLRRSLEGRGPRRPASRPSSSSSATSTPSTRTAHAPSRSSRPSSRVKTVRHPYILSLERFDIIDGQLIIVMELADRTLWDRFKECRAPGPARHSARRAAGYMEETAEALDLMNGATSCSTSTSSRRTSSSSTTTSRSPTSAWSRTSEGDGRHGHRRRHAGLRRPGDLRRQVSRFSDQYSLAIVYPGAADRPRPFTAARCGS